MSNSQEKKEEKIGGAVGATVGAGAGIAGVAAATGVGGSAVQWLVDLQLWVVQWLEEF